MPSKHEDASSCFCHPTLLILHRSRRPSPNSKPFYFCCSSHFLCFLDWITRLTDKLPIRAKRIATRTKSGHPLLVRNEDVCHIANHGDEIGRQSFELRRSAGDPAHLVGIPGPRRCSPRRRQRRPLGKRRPGHVPAVGAVPTLRNSSIPYQARATI